MSELIREDTERRILKRYREADGKIQPSHNTFPTPRCGLMNARRRAKRKVEFEELVKFICGCVRRKTYQQVRKDFEDMQRRHLQVA